MGDRAAAEIRAIERARMNTNAQFFMGGTWQKRMRCFEAELVYALEWMRER